MSDNLLPDITVRVVDPEEDVIAELLQENIDEMRGLGVVVPELSDLLLRSFRQEGKFLGAWSDSPLPVGMVGVRLLEPSLAELKRLYVRPSHRRMGVGAHLMRAAIRSAALLGANRLRLDTAASLTAAVALYRSMGFQEIQRYNNNPEAELWFELSLAS
ncbi:MAG: GNAT family N-acetyltransferase [Gammaproteobacteria bacterium]